MRRTLVVALGLLALAVVPAGSAGQLGAQLYGANCISCHGSNGHGIHDRGPALRGVGAGAADFYLSTGYMPLASPRTQPHRSRIRFSPAELAALVSYVASFGGGPRICIGNTFAMLETVLVLATLLRRWHVQRASDAPLRFRPRMTLAPLGPIELVFNRV